MTAALRTPVRRDRRHATTVGLELITGVSALAGGIALAAKPDGSLLNAKLSALNGSPFTDWRIPGVLLATLVGGGVIIAGISELASWRHARTLSLTAGAGLIAFECVELAWLGFQPLEAIFACVGLGTVVLRRPTHNSTRVGHAKARRTTRPGDGSAQLSI